MLILGLLIAGCKSDEPGVSSYDSTSPTVTAPVPAPAVTAPAPAPEVPVQAPAPAHAAPRSAHPASVAQALENGDLIYVVKSGDTVPRIAKAHGTTAQALRTANSLKNDRLVVGMKLKLPEKAG